MAVTIKDVAREAGVSVATVSKVLNQRPGISEATARRVEAVMRALDFAPNSRAASLARRSTRNVIFLTCLPPDIAYTNPHRFDILCGAESVLAEKGYTLTVVDASRDPAPGATAERIIRQKLADGMIVHGAPVGRELAALLIHRQFPHILIGHPGSEARVCWVDVDQTLGGQIATEHLLARGYRRIGFLTEGEEEIAYLRLRGFRISMGEAGVPVREDWLVHASAGLAGSYEGAFRLLQMEDRPDAVVCGSNLLAFGLYQVAQRLGVAIPEQMALITFDRFPLSGVIDPLPSLVQIDVHDLGRTAGAMLLKKLHDPDLLVQSYTTLPRLICNATTPFFPAGPGSRAEREATEGGRHERV